MKVELHLTTKNGLSIVVGFCVVGLAVIPLKVEASHLTWPRWQIAIYGLALTGVLALVVQAFMQSREDHERDGRERERDKRQDSIDSKIAAILEQLKGGAPKLATEALALEPLDTKAQNPSIDGEVYRLVMSPRSFVWPLLRDMYKMKGREDEAGIDTDILVEMYLVNKDNDKTRYVREILLSAEVNGKRVEFKRQDNLWADDFNDMSFEYGLKEKEGSETEPIGELSSKFPLALAAGQPVEGWVRFMATDINADKIAQGTVTVTVIDSLENEYAISRVPTNRERRGEIGLRRR